MKLSLIPEDTFDPQEGLNYAAAHGLIALRVKDATNSWPNLDSKHGDYRPEYGTIITITRMNSSGQCYALIEPSEKMQSALDSEY